MSVPTLASTAPTRQPTTTSAPERWPAGIPTWMEQELSTLSAQGDLFGVPPQAIASIAKGESGYELTGPGINPEGYGGFLGLPATQSVDTPAGTVYVPAALLKTPGPTAFKAQAEIAAGRISTLASGTEGGTLIRAIQAYGNGPGRAGTPTPDAEVYQETVLGGAPAPKISQPAVTTGILTWLSGAGAVWGGGKAIIGGAAHAVGGAISHSVWGSVEPFLAKAMLVLGGIALIVLGLYKAAAPSVKQGASDMAKDAAKGAIA